MNNVSNTSTARDERFSGWKTATVTKRQMLAFEAKLAATSDERFQRDFRFSCAEGTKVLMASMSKYAQYVAEYLAVTAEQARRGSTVSRDLENHVFAT